MTGCKTYGQRGVALIMALMLLLLLTALAAALVFVANMETAVNANYRREQVLYFAAKAGIEEARDRLLWTNATTLITPPQGTCAPAANCLPAVPAFPGPTTGNNGVFYVLGGTNPAAVTPWTASTIYTDDELCHDLYALPGQTPEPSDVRCVDEPTGNTWYKTGTSNIPWAGAAAALPYQWVRISWKLNGSVDNGTPSRMVDPAFPPTRPVCWDGVHETLLNTAWDSVNNVQIQLVTGNTDCTQMPNLLPIPGPAATPVYLVTSLAVDPISGARRMVQSELASHPSTPYIYGLYATSPACGALTMSGGATTDSYSSAGTPPGTYAGTHTNTGGDVGSAENVNISGNGTIVGGSIGVPTATTGACPAGLTTTQPNNGMVAGQTPPNTLIAAGPFVFATPPRPSGTTNTPYNLTKPPGCPTSFCMVPGTYGDVSLNGANKVLTLAPGVYNLNSISVSSSGTSVQISPPGAVVLNIAGQGTMASAPVSFNSNGSIVNTSGIANNFQINYGGTGTITLAGGTTAYAVVNAPNATVNLSGTGNAPAALFGAVIGSTITMSGHFNFHYDLNTKIAPPSTGSLNEISFRDVAY
ncbi:MAG: hypothetical protein DMG72_13830 [Acidobacteria bacterium]|nr:MAG: hypothetical protein DMG72_13830 [Acidobacteriota bacterium]